MFRLLILLSAIFVISLCNLNESFVKTARIKRQNNENFECGNFECGLISGGNETRRGEFPWLVAIFRRRLEGPPKYICSGTLVSSTKVVTAAHCIQNKERKSATLARDLLLYFGAHDLDDPYETDRIVKSPSEIILHDGWNPFNFRLTDDIAILTLEKEIHFSDYIRPICLMSEDLGITEGVVTAWGKDGKSLIKFENLPKKLEIPIVSDGDCYRENSKLAEIAWKRSFCAGRKGVGVCRGDSGAGFYVKFNNKFYIKGLVSSSSPSEGFRDCYTDNFAIYTDVVKYSKFIGVAKPKQSCGVMSDESSLVVGGKFSTRAQFPWLVSIFVENYGEFVHFGSGSLISNRHVISKASSVAWADDHKYYHAVETDRVKLYLGTTKYESIDEPDAIEIGVSKITVYPGARKLLPNIFNIAVITLDQPVTFSSVISPICLQSFIGRNDAGLAAYGIGYGWDQTRNDTGVKKHVKMTINSDKRCRSFWEKELEIGKASKFFCASGSKDNAPFRNDQPLYMKVDGKWFLRGMLSMLKRWSNGTLATEYPLLYEDISMFVDWIEEQAKK